MSVTSSTHTTSPYRVTYFVKTSFYPQKYLCWARNERDAENQFRMAHRDARMERVELMPEAMAA